MRNSGPRKKPYSVHFDQETLEAPVARHFETFANSQHPKYRNHNADLAFKQGHSGFPLDNLNDSVDDDNTTTTSGSYTIDHEDHPDEMITFSGFGLKDVYV